MTITLPQDLEALLAEKARSLGTTPDALAVAELRRVFAGPEVSGTSPQPPSLLTYLGDFVGAVDGSTEPLSEDCGRRFAEHLAEKHKRGGL